MEIKEEDILDFIQGNLDKERRAELEKSLADSPELKQETEDMQYILQLTDTLQQQKKIDTKANWRKLSGRIARLNFRRRLWDITRTAAVILLPIAIALQILFMTRGTEQPAAREIEFTSAYGLVSKITLPDGSKVWLNSGSQIKYPDVFDKQQRQVKLAGEAYFEVQSDPEHRFDVITPEGITVSAFGTEFNVNAYRDDESEEVVLSNGHVDVFSQRMNRKVELTPGQRALVNKGGNEMIVSDANVYAKTAWKDGKMVFKRADMNEVVKKLSRHFNVDISLNDPTLYTYQYSATFTTESIEQILGLLEQSSPIQWRIIEPKQQSDSTFNRREVIISMKK